jgi:hypothetical protein
MIATFFIYYFPASLRFEVIMNLWRLTADAGRINKSTLVVCGLQAQILRIPSLLEADSFMLLALAETHPGYDGTSQNGSGLTAYIGSQE